MIDGPTTDDYPLAAVVERAETFHPNRSVVSRRPDGSVHRTTLGSCATRAGRIASALRDSAIADAPSLRRHLETEFAKRQVPEQFEFVPAIPTNATGKFKKNELRSTYGNVDRPAAVTPREEPS
ncbi:hypothetical protein ACWEO2_03300 [Nocardia sp. NPDC004278]